MLKTLSSRTCTESGVVRGRSTSRRPSYRKRQVSTSSRGVTQSTRIKCKNAGSTPSRYVRAGFGWNR